MSQFEQENDLGRGGGEVDDETLREAWRNREELGAEGNLDPSDPDAPAADRPWAKTSSGGPDEA